MNSKLSFVYVCLPCFLLPTVMGLICYQCQATESWERCRTTTKTCSSESDACVKAHFNDGDVDHFRKDCTSKAECSSEGYFPCRKAVECDVSCCYSNDCNAGSLFLISGILFLTCAVISVVPNLN